VRLQHFRQARQKLSEAPRIVAIVGGQRYRDDVDQRKTQPVAVEYRAIAADKPILLQPLATPRALRRRQVDVPGKVAVGQPCMSCSSAIILRSN